MTDISTLSDDEIVAEVQRRLDRGTLGWEGLMSTDQCNHRDNWCALLETVYHARNRYPDEFGTKLVHSRALELVDEKGPQVRMYAINTAFHGKDTAFQDHAPKAPS